MQQLASDKVVVIKGGGDVGSAVAHLLYRSGYLPVIVESPTPSTTRRRMAFATAVFEGEAELEGVRAERVDSLETLKVLLLWGKVVPVFVGPVEAVLATLTPGVVVDARMRKRETPEAQIDQAPLVIGLGPGFRAGETVHVVIETNRGPHLGRIIPEGGAEPYTGEPISIAGYKRERYSYAPTNGTFHTTLDVGMRVQAGDVLGRIGAHELRAQVSGIIRGITRNGIGVLRGTKVAEIDPRGQEALISGIAERPRKIAAGVLEAIRSARKAGSS